MYFKCFSAKLAHILCRNGFELIDTEVNYNKPQYMVYIFEDSEELRTVFNKYCENKM